MSVFRVDDYPGTDTQRLAAACNAALKAIPSTVELPNRELRLTAYQNVRPGVNVVGSGVLSVLFLDYLGAASPSGNSPFGLRIMGAGPPTLLEGFAIRARPAGYYRLIHVQQAADVTFSLLDFGVCGQSFVTATDSSNLAYLDLYGPYGGDNSYQRQAACYKLSVAGCNGVTMHRLTMGRPDDDHNQSFVTVNNSHGVTVADSTFYGSKTYCLNTHGTGSTGVVFARNELRPGSDALYGAILVGNEYWGADLDVTVTDNTMVGAGRFLQVRAGSEVNMRGNTVPACNELVGFGPGGGTVHLTGDGS